MTRHGQGGMWVWRRSRKLVFWNARPARRAGWSSVFHYFARRGPTTEAHRRALNRPDGLLFPRLLSQSVYNRRLRATADLMEAALRWLADHTPATTELLRLLDGTPVVCGRSRATAARSDLAGWAGDGHDASHHCFSWGARLLLVTTPTGR
jgi:hypothetical protein